MKKNNINKIALVGFCGIGMSLCAGPTTPPSSPSNVYKNYSKARGAGPIPTPRVQKATTPMATTPIGLKATAPNTTLIIDSPIAGPIAGSLATPLDASGARPIAAPRRKILGTPLPAIPTEGRVASQAARGGEPGQAAKGSIPSQAASGVEPNQAASGVEPGQAAKRSTPGQAAKGSTPGQAAKGSTPSQAAKGVEPDQASGGGMKVIHANTTGGNPSKSETKVSKLIAGIKKVKQVTGAVLGLESASAKEANTTPDKVYVNMLSNGFASNKEQIFKALTTKTISFKALGHALLSKQGKASLAKGEEGTAELQSERLDAYLLATDVAIGDLPSGQPVSPEKIKQFQNALTKAFRGTQQWQLAETRGVELANFTIALHLDGRLGKINK